MVLNRVPEEEEVKVSLQQKDINTYPFIILNIMPFPYSHPQPLYMTQGEELTMESAFLSFKIMSKKVLRAWTSF